MFYSLRDSYHLLNERPQTQSQTQRIKQIKSENLINYNKSAPQSPGIIYQNKIGIRKKKKEGKKEKQLDFMEMNKLHRIDRAYNKIADLDDKQQIWNSLKNVQNVQERIVLVDKILQRKKEMKQMKEKMSMYKLAPIFQILINKLNKKKELEKIQTQKCNNNQFKPFKIVDKGLQTKGQNKQDSSFEGQVKRLQQKFTTQVAFAWLTDKRKKKNEVQVDKDKLKSVSESGTRMKYNPQTVSFQSKMLIEKGKSAYQTRLSSAQILRKIIVNAKPKTNTGVHRVNKYDWVDECADNKEEQLAQVIERKLDGFKIEKVKEKCNIE